MPTTSQQRPRATKKEDNNEKETFQVRGSNGGHKDRNVLPSYQLFFAKSTRPHLRALTSTVSKNKLDQCLFAHQRVYEHLLSINLDKDDSDIRKLQTTDVVFCQNRSREL